MPAWALWSTMFAAATLCFPPRHSDICMPSILYSLYSVQMALCAGAATLLLPVFTPPGLIKAIDTKRPTHLFAGAAHIAACRGAGLLDSQKLSSLRVVILSGAAVPPDLVLDFSPR